MSNLDYITIFVFAIGILSAGLAFSGKQKNIKSFFSGGGTVPWPVSGLSLFMGFFSAGTFVVWGAIAYSHGAVAVSIQESMCVAGLLVGIFIVTRWHKTKAITAAEYITERFGGGTQKTYSFLFLFISLFNTGAFLYPIAKIVSVSFGSPIELCIVVIGLFCILYVSLGGLWSVVITDVLQFIVLTVAVLITVPLSLEKVGNTFITQSPENFFSPFDESYPLLFIIAFGIYNAIYIGGNWAYVQRYTSVRTEKDSRKVAFLFSSLYLVFPVLWMLPPMIYRIVNPGLVGNEDENAYLLMCREALPDGMLGMMIGGMIFATASSFNATLNISAGVFTNDIFKRIRPDSSDKVLMRTAKLSTIVFGLLAVCVALLIPSMGGIVNVVISIAALTGVPLYLPVIWSLFSAYQTKKTVLFTTIASLLINLALKFVMPCFGFALDRTMEMVAGVSIPVLMLGIYELYARLVNKEDPAYRTYSVMLAEKKAFGTGSETDNLFGIKVLRIGVFVAGIMIMLLSFLTSSHRILILSCALFLFAIGMLLGIKHK